MFKRKKETVPTSPIGLIEDTLPLFAKEIEKDLDKTYDALHEYDRYEVDALILNNYRDITDVDPTDPTSDYTNLSSEHLKKARELLKLLGERYKELEGNEKIDFSDDDQGKASIMIERILKEWEERYFFLRVERASINSYNEWVIALAAFSGLGDKKIDRRDHEKREPYYIAISSIELVPVYGSKSLNIIVPPEIEVSGNPGHTNVYRWDDIDREKPRDFSVELFPSTCRMLVDRLGLDEYKDTSTEDLINDTEADLTKHK